jgi:hypothetical protein
MAIDAKDAGEVAALALAASILLIVVIRQKGIEIALS